MQTRAKQSRNCLFEAEESKARESDDSKQTQTKGKRMVNRNLEVNINNQNGKGTVKGQANQNQYKGCRIQNL